MTDAVAGREGRPGSALGGSSHAPAGPTPASRPHPLLGLFPLTVMTLAAFMVAFALMMARMGSGVNPPRRPGALAAAPPAAGGQGVITTRTSTAGAGAVAASSAPVVSGGQSPAGGVPAVLTRASGAERAGEVRDE